MGYGIELKNRITGETAKMRHPRLVRFYFRGAHSNADGCDRHGNELPDGKRCCLVRGLKKKRSSMLFFSDCSTII